MRANTLSADPAELRAELEAAGEPLAVPGTSHDADTRFVWPAGGARLGRARSATLRCAALGDGRMFAQSRGAQAVVEVLGPEAGGEGARPLRGPGVKTVAIAARLGAEGEVVAVEKDPGRARQVEELASGRAQ